MKKILFTIILALSLKADVNQAIYNMIDSEDYNTHLNLINHIFKNQSNFYKDGNIDYIKISEELDKNGLLKLNYDEIKDIEVTFTFSSSPKKSFKNITDILKAIGNQHFITKNQATNGEQLFWSIKLKTAAAINPLRLSLELQNANCRVLKIRREAEDKWSYFIDSSNSTLYKVEDLVNNSSLSLRKPTKPYMIELSNSEILSIETNSGTIWHPNVVFYDDELNILRVFEKEKRYSKLRLNVPSEARFVKIDDFYALTNIRNGLNITKE